MPEMPGVDSYNMPPPPVIGAQAQQAPGSSPVARVRTPTEVLADRRKREEQKRAQGGTSAAERLAEVTGTSGQQQQQYRSGRSTQPLAEITNVGTSSRAPRQSGQQGSGIPVPQSRKESTRASRQNENAPPSSMRGQADAEKARAAQAQPQMQQQYQDTADDGRARNSNGTSNGNRNSGNNGAAENGSRRGSKNATSTFPHAFERWETLSSHWEGLTSYWMKRLEHNSSELSSNPLNQQLSRQVTDLSAAGANLFHAVVELQRLRASSERKFQRWFFETRHEQERKEEQMGALTTMLQKAQERVAVLESERVDEQTVRTSASTMLELERLRQERQRHELEMKDMRRELNISRDEARRGWEEIGRLEAQERERIEYLKQGVPVWHGQIQVVPVATTQGTDELAALQQAVLPGNIPRSTQVNPGEMANPYDGQDDDVLRPEDPRGAPPSQSQPQQSPRVGSTPRGQGQFEAQQRAQPQYQGQAQVQIPGHSPQYAESEIETDPFVDERRRDQSSMQPSLLPPPGQGQGYFSGSTSARAMTSAPRSSAAAVIPEEEEQAYYRQQQAQGRQEAMASPSYEGEEYGDNMDYVIDPQEQQSPHMVQSHGPVSGNDGLTAGWGLPRHQHPTRLSDVLEEDERSRRTSPSHASERSRGYR